MADGDDDDRTSSSEGGDATSADEAPRAQPPPPPPGVPSLDLAVVDAAEQQLKAAASEVRAFFADQEQASSDAAGVTESESEADPPPRARAPSGSFSRSGMASLPRGTLIRTESVRLASPAGSSVSSVVVSQRAAVAATYKLCVLGRANVGKTSLLQRYCKGVFRPTQPTIGLSMYTKDLKIGESYVRLELWDTAGLERGAPLMPQYYRAACGAALVYDASDQSTYVRLVELARLLQEYNARDMEPTAGDARQPLPVMVIANKVDLLAGDERALASHEMHMRDVVRRDAMRYGWYVQSCSAKTAANVEEALQSFALAVHMHAMNEQRASAAWHSSDGKPADRRPPVSMRGRVVTIRSPKGPPAAASCAC